MEAKTDRIRELNPLRSGDRHKDFWALRDVSFQVERGEVVSLVGPNGCGKSTLLQIVAGILQPTTGRVVTRGRIAALLELGAGFNPEFSGRENVYLNGEIMGLSRAEIDRAMPSIEAFAEIGEHVRARQLCEKLLSFSSPLALYAEEIDPATGRHMGNFPQGFTHLALINAVMHVIEAEQAAQKTARAAPDRLVF